MTRTNKRWQDLAVWQKIAVIILGTAQFMLLGTALWDIRQRSWLVDVRQHRGNRGTWGRIDEGILPWCPTHIAATTDESTCAMNLLKRRQFNPTAITLSNFA